MKKNIFICAIIVNTVLFTYGQFNIGLSMFAVVIVASTSWYMNTRTRFEDMKHFFLNLELQLDFIEKTKKTVNGNAKKKLAEIEKQIENLKEAKTNLRHPNPKKKQIAQDAFEKMIVQLIQIQDFVKKSLESSNDIVDMKSSSLAKMVNEMYNDYKTEDLLYHYKPSKQVMYVIKSAEPITIESIVTTNEKLVNDIAHETLVN